MSREIIKVSAVSKSAAVAGAIAGVVREEGGAIVRAVGPAAVNQAVKAIAIANGYLAEDGVAIVAIPSMVDVLIDGNERTAVMIEVEVKK